MLGVFGTFIVRKKRETRARNLAGIKFAGDWFPVRAEEELLGVIVFIVSVGEEHLCVDVSSEAGRALQEVFGAGGKLWLNAKV